MLNSMTLRTRLSKLERIRQKPDVSTWLELDLPGDICARISKAQLADTFPKSLSSGDLRAIRAAWQKAEGERDGRR